MITDDECRRRGGQVVDEHTYEHLDRRRDPSEPLVPFRRCDIPSPMNNQACVRDADCQGGRCFCDGELARPNPMDDPKLRALDGRPWHGRCSDRPIPSGDWFCLMRDGKASLSGIIID